jgi:hypothetical protein
VVLFNWLVLENSGSEAIWALSLLSVGACGSVVVKALCCKPEGRGFKSR